MQILQFKIGGNSLYPAFKYTRTENRVGQQLFSLDKQHHGCYDLIHVK